jgi:hypothetical protein
LGRAQESVDTLTLLLSCEKRLNTMLEIIGKAAPSQAPAKAESTFVTEPVSRSCPRARVCVC